MGIENQIGLRRVLTLYWWVGRQLRLRSLRHLVLGQMPVAGEVDLTLGGLLEV